MEQWWKKLCEFESVWQHSGDIKAPHVVLRSGRHSDGFIDTLQFLCGVKNLHDAAAALAVHLNDAIGHEEVDWVFGSPMAGIPIATIVAPMVWARNVGFTEKTGEKDLICRFDIEPKHNVLVVEEMTTTGDTPQRAIDAILARNPQAGILPFVGAFLIRCGKNPPGLHNAGLVPVIDLPDIGITFNEWEPGECPLCSHGSRAITNCKRVWKDLLITMTQPEHPVG